MSGTCLEPPPDLVEIADALEAMSRPHIGSAWSALKELYGLPCTTERQETIWKQYVEGEADGK